MAYTNSANVKFPKADLIIEEDGSGNVTSCYNRTNSTEYVHPAYDTLATITVTNNTSASRTQLYANLLSGTYIRGTSTGVSAGGSSNISALIGTVMSMTGSYKYVKVSGDCTIINNNNVLIEGDCVLTVENV